MRTFLFFFACVLTGSTVAQGTYTSQPDISARSVDILQISGLRFKDLNKNKRLDAYEDWRLPVEKRIEDLVRQMDLPEKIGMLLINTLNAERGGKVPRKGYTTY
jgi:beta-glucosidase